MAVEYSRVVLGDLGGNLRREEERKGKGRKEEKTDKPHALLGPEGKGFKDIRQKRYLGFILLACLFGLQMRSLR